MVEFDLQKDFLVVSFSVFLLSQLARLRSSSWRKTTWCGGVEWRRAGGLIEDIFLKTRIRNDPKNERTLPLLQKLYKYGKFSVLAALGSTGTRILISIENLVSIWSSKQFKYGDLSDPGLTY